MLLVSDSVNGSNNFNNQTFKLLKRKRNEKHLKKASRYSMRVEMQKG